MFLQIQPKIYATLYCSVIMKFSLLLCHSVKSP